MPYATTELNIHQLAHNNSLLEARILELEEENKKLNEELNKITEALTKASKAKFMKNSDLSSLYDE